LLNEGWKANGRRPLHLRKAALLGKLRSTGKLDYKRYLASPCRSAGVSKSVHWGHRIS